MTRLFRLLAILIVFILSACGEEVVQSDNTFARSFIEKNFSKGKNFNQVKAVFESYGRKVELFRECEDDFQSCPYLAVGSIPTPSDHWYLGKGDIQIYFTFNENKQLTGQFYEIYYPRGH